MTLGDLLPVITLREFHNEGNFKVTEEMLECWREQGYLLVRDMFSADEMEKVTKTAKSDDMNALSFEVKDDEKRGAKLALWRRQGNDVFGTASRLPRMVNTAASLLGGEVYHYHSKLMMKQPKTGGKHLWHQDYGYWYKRGTIRPDLLTVAVGVDDCSILNGCLQVVPRSHLLGRLDHGTCADQQEADPARLEYIFEHGGLLKAYAELQKGDAFFFHSNILHQSANNESDFPRYMILTVYNRSDNFQMHTFLTTSSDYAPIDVCDDDALKNWKGGFKPDVENSLYLRKSDDKLIEQDSKKDGSGTASTY